MQPASTNKKAPLKSGVGVSEEVSSEFSFISLVSHPNIP
jgi:hypothetical protein